MDGTPPYRDSSLSTERRVSDLLDRMTVEEMAGQLVGAWVGRLGTEKTVADVEREIRESGVGHASPFGIGASPIEDPIEAAETANRLQRVAVEETRLGIPLSIPVDAIHGHAYVAGTTIFPHGLGMGATRDADLVERGARVTAREARATGATVTYAPTCDVARDQRWGRTFETFGESHYLSGELAAAKIRGYQHDLTSGVAATAKHFPAYSQPERGEDTAPVEVSPSTLRRVFLSTFERALDADPETVMPCYNSIDGDPVHGSRRFLTGLLREELGFDGVVASDWMGVAQLHEDHRVASSPTEASLLAHRAGLDVGSVVGPDGADRIVDLVEAGELSEHRLAESVRRVLSLKIRLGVFDDPYVDTESVEDALRTDEHRRAGLEAARQSMTLLSNDGTLPLDADSDIFVTGPNADALRNQLGGWSVTDADPPGTTILDAIESRCDGTVTYEPGSGIADPEDVAAAREGAADADAAVVVCGENWYLHEFGGPEHLVTDSEQFPRRPDLRLPAVQQELLQEVQGTGTPTVLVLVTGRPLSTPWAAEHCAATLMAYYPGSEGGRAVAETLFGSVDPGGALPISVPRSTGDLPVRFDYLDHPHPMGEERHTSSYDPLYPFGHGLSYTDFEHRDVELSAETIGPAGRLGIDVTVANTGDRDGQHVLDCYVRDEVSSRVTPVREHVATGRVVLEAGESKTVRLDVDAAQLAVVTGEGRRVEPGTFTLLIDGTDGVEPIERTVEVVSGYANGHEANIE